jgi:hypothetical protein
MGGDFFADVRIRTVIININLRNGLNFKFSVYLFCKENWRDPEDK